MGIAICFGVCIGLGTHNVWLGIAGFIAGAYFENFEDLLIKIKDKLPK